MRNDSPTRSSQRSWWKPLESLLIAAAMPRVVQELRQYGTANFKEIVRDLDTPLASAFEREVARTLNRHGEDLIPTETLMPPMMTRFGLAAEDFGPDERVHFQELQSVCNRCPAMGRCWRALRAEAGWETCRAFCPNTEAFERKSRAAA